MAQNGKQQRRVQDNYFKKELSNYRGSAPFNFMANKDNNRRNRDCKSICKDLASGNINVETESGYFLQPELLDHLITFTNSKYWYHSRIVYCVQYTYNAEQKTYGAMANDIGSLAIINEHTKSQMAYQILRDGFTSIKNDPVNVKGWLVTMMTNLSAGRYAGNI